MDIKGLYQSLVKTRGTGKTTVLAKHLPADSVLVVHTREFAKAIRQKHKGECVVAAISDLHIWQDKLPIICDNLIVETVISENVMLGKQCVCLMDDISSLIISNEKLKQKNQELQKDVFFYERVFKNALVVLPRKSKKLLNSLLCSFSGRI